MDKFWPLWYTFVPSWSILVLAYFTDIRPCHSSSLNGLWVHLKSQYILCSDSRETLAFDTSISSWSFSGPCILSLKKHLKFFITKEFLASWKKQKNLAHQFLELGKKVESRHSIDLSNQSGWPKRNNNITYFLLLFFTLHWF